MSTTVLPKQNVALQEGAESTLASVARQSQTLSICHLTPVQDRLDSRTYVMEMLPLTKQGCNLTLIGAHGLNQRQEPVDFVSIPKRQTRVTRILFAAAMAFRAVRQPAHLYHVHNPEMIPAGLLLKIFGGKKVVYDTQEDHPSMMLTKAYLPSAVRGIASKAVATIERLAARVFDGFIAADSGTLRSTARVGRSRKMVFYNLPNLDFFPSPELVEKRFDIVYRGGLSERAGTFILLSAIRELQHRGLNPRLLLFGYTDSKADRAKLHEHIENMKLTENVVLEGRIDHSKMAATLSLARISVCPLLEIPKFRNNIPVKVFESWACGIPVVCSDLAPIRPFFKGHKFGFLVKPGSVHALADRLEQLLNNPEETAQMGRAARNAVVDRYNNNYESKKLLAFYKRVLSETS
jgi:glycosyltransferase involved in cell wall biosynthesis